MMNEIEVLRLNRIEIDDSVFDCSDKLIKHVSIDYDTQSPPTIPLKILKFLNNIEDYCDSRSLWRIEGNKLHIELEVLCSERFGGSTLSYTRYYEDSSCCGEIAKIGNTLIAEWGRANGEIGVDSVPIVGPYFDDIPETAEAKENLLLDYFMGQNISSPFLHFFINEVGWIFYYLKKHVTLLDVYNFQTPLTMSRDWLYWLRDREMFPAMSEEEKYKIVGEVIKSVIGSDTVSGISSSGIQTPHGLFSASQMGSGVQSLLISVPNILSALMENRTLIVNPIDANLHPISARALMLTIEELMKKGDPNRVGRLIYTTNYETTPIYEK